MGSGPHLYAGEPFPFRASLAQDDGTVFQGVITVGVDFATHACFLGGSLNS